MLKTQYTITFSVTWEGVNTECGSQWGVTVLERKNSLWGRLKLIIFIIFPRFRKREDSDTAFPKSSEQHAGVKEGVEILFYMFNFWDIYAKETFLYQYWFPLPEKW